jgi:hypothetical protein
MVSLFLCPMDDPAFLQSEIAAISILKRAAQT